MAELFNDAAGAIAVVSLAALCLSLGYLRSQTRMLRIQRELADHLLAELVHGGRQTLSLDDAETLLVNGDWRRLSDDDQRKLKAALVVLLAQMDRRDLNSN